MSLNGLEKPEVQEAYQDALAEAGGWFILKYISRDAVEILAAGKGGVHEARNAIAKYEEKSPLYGLLIYRRRKVLIKFVPDGTSRLLQARTAVHFQDVTERFQPYETLLEIGAADGLNDTSLAAAFPLHTASPSTSSNRLHEISEDGEEGGPTFRRAQNQIPTSSRPERMRAERRVDQLMRSPPQPPTIYVSEDLTPSPMLSPPKTSISQFLVREESGHRSITSLGSQSTTSMMDYAPSEGSMKGEGSAMSATEPTRSTLTSAASENFEPARDGAYGLRSPEQRKGEASDPLQPAVSEEDSARTNAGEELPQDMNIAQRALEKTPSTTHSPQKSSEPERPYMDEIDWSKYEPKPKVKLGPRLVSKDMKRPAVASVSGMPANHRPQPKKVEVTRPKSLGPPNVATPTFLPAPPPIPDMPEYIPRPVSRGSVKSLPSHKSSNMTPDKIRLMKAVEMRKRQLRKSNPNPPELAAAALKTADVPEVPTIRAAPEPVPEVGPQLPLEEKEPEPEPDVGVLEAPQTAPKKADSGIEMEYERLYKHEDEPSYAMETCGEPAGEQEGQATPAAPPTQRHSLAVDTSRSLSHQDSERVEEPPEKTEKALPLPPWLSSTESADSPTLGRDPVLGLDEALSQGKSSPQPTFSQIPTIQMDDGTRPQISSSAPPIPQKDIEDELEESASLDEEATSRSLTEPHQNTQRKQNSDVQKKRRGYVEPLHLDMRPGSPEGAEYLSDEEFMEELRSATFEEAKPISVQKSPAAAYLPRRPSGASMHSNNSGKSGRSFNSIDMIPISSLNPPQLDKYLESPSDRPSQERQSPPQTRRSQVMSLPMTPDPEKKDLLSTSRNMTVSSGISRRIQALAGTSSRESSQYTLDPPLTPGVSLDEGVATRKTLLKSSPQPRAGTLAKMRRSSGKVNAFPTPVNTPGSTSPAATHPVKAVWSVQNDPTTHRDSVSVTARIVRTQSNGQTDQIQPAEGAPPELQESQLFINHKQGVSQPSITKLPAIDTSPPAPPPKSEFVPSMVSPPISPIGVRSSMETTRTLHSASRKSFGRHRRPELVEEPVTPAAPAVRTTSQTSLASTEDKSAREGSRTSRFFKRMSGMGGMGGMGGSSRRRSIAQTLGSNNSSPTSVAAPRNNSVASHDRSDMPPAAVDGDLNVQFPDSLLWKRRWVEIDAQGYLVLSIPQAMEHQRGVSRKSHLGEFKRPFAPDLDRQELPHSVLLDFVDGTSLQAACEDTMTQAQVLSVLRTYHKAWSSV